MCGGSDASPQESSYSPPQMKDVYGQFRETGQVPYSYYGVGAPTRDGELDLVRKSYPGAFSASSAQRRPDSYMAKLIRALGGAFAGKHK